MNLTVQDYLDTICATLRANVLQEVGNQHARTQVLAAIDIIEKLSTLVDWSPELVAERLEALARGQQELAGIIRNSGVARESETTVFPANTDVPDTPAGRERAMNEWIDWLYRAGIEDSQKRREIELKIRDTLQDYLSAERRRIAPTDYSSMSS